MENSIDKRIITKEFLDEFFPEHTSFKSKEKYISFKQNINQQRTKSGKPVLCDFDLYQIISEHSKIKNQYS